MYKDTDIQKLIDELDIVQVIGEYVTLKRTGANYKGLSPFREEKTPSFVVSPTKNIFKDFSTGIGGNVISFYMKINNLTFVEALEELARKYDINIKKLNTPHRLANSVRHRLQQLAQPIILRKSSPRTWAALPSARQNDVSLHGIDARVLSGEK